MACEKCEELCVRFAIRTPHDLQTAIKIVNESVFDGAIVEIKSETTLSMVPFCGAVAGLDWGDVVDYRFECKTCGERFSLHAETYHGSGGYWEPEKSESVRKNL
jgi:hypothetical protein